MNITTTDWVVIGAYFILMIVIGMIFKTFSANMSDYVRAGGRASWWLAGMSIFVAGFSALTFTGISGQAYIAGWSVLIIFWCNAFVFFVQAAIVGPWFRQSRAITPGDVIRQRFGVPTEQLFVVAGVFGSMLFGGLMLLGLATFLAAIFGFNIVAIVLVVSIIVGFYSVAGGGWGVIATDYIQSLILLAITITVSVLCIQALGGVDGLFEGIREGGLQEDFALVKPSGYDYGEGLQIEAERFTVFWIVMNILYSVVMAFHPGTSYRYLMVKDGRSARKAALLAGTLTLIGSAFWFIPAMTGRILYSEKIEAVTGISNVADAAYAIVSLELLPSGLMGLVIIAMFAATMSTLDGALTGAAGHIVNNILPPLRRRLGWKTPENDLSELILVRRTNLVLLVLLVSLALGFHFGLGQMGLFGILIHIIALTAGPMAPPLAASLFVKRAPQWAALASIGSGFLVGLSILLLSNAGLEILWQERLLWIAGSSLSVFLISRLIAPVEPNSPYKKQVDGFFEQIHTPVNFEEEIGEANDYRQLRILGSLAMVVGVGICLILLVSLPGDRAAVLGVGGSILLVGVFMYGCGRRLRRKGLKPVSEC